MTGSGACRVIRLELGVVLGAIEPADRLAIDDHLARCAACRDLLAELADLPWLLSRVTVDDVDSIARLGDSAP